MRKITLELVRPGFDAKEKATANVLTEDSNGIRAAIDRAVKKLNGDKYVWDSGVKGMMTVLRGTCVIGEYSAMIGDDVLSRSYVEWVAFNE